MKKSKLSFSYVGHETLLVPSKEFSIELSKKEVVTYGIRDIVGSNRCNCAAIGVVVHVPAIQIDG